MLKIVLAAAAICAAAFFAACGGASDSNASSGNGELPEGINTKPLENGVTPTPGIPANAGVNDIPQGTTPTPGIPANSNEAKVPSNGATPTPGIPDPETIRRQLNRKDLDANVVNQAPASNSKIEKNPLGRPRKLNGN